MKDKKTPKNPKELAKLEELHSEAISKFQDSFALELDQRDKCLFDMSFTWVEGSQWEDQVYTSRNDRPRMSINKVRLPVSQVLGEMKQNRTTIKVRPVKGGANQKDAEILNGLISAILKQSRFNNIKDMASKEQVTGGIGGWYVTTQYEDDSFDQEICIKPIQSAASSVYYDPSAKGLMKEDSTWFIVTEDISLNDFQKRYPDASASSLTTNVNTSMQTGSHDTVRIADYWVKEPYTQTLAQMSDGSIIEINKETTTILDEMALTGITVVKTRQKECHKVKMYKISASEVLEGPFEWAGKYIPVVPVFGYSIWINGQHFYQGMTRSAIDAQRIYNYSTSAMIEAAALTPKDPYWITPTQAKGYEGQLKNFNNLNTPFMLYNPDDKAPGAPQRTGAPTVQSALIQQVQQADLDIQSTTGLFSPSLGNEQHDQSGRAILALQKQSSLGTFELTDNLEKAVSYTGEILLDLIPRIYDTERQITILGIDGQSTETVINKTILDVQTGQEVIVNDLSKGKYSIIASTAPSFESQRAESVNVLTRLSESNPNMSPFITDILTEALDFPFSEELTKRVRGGMIQQGLIQPNEQEAAQLQAMAPQEPSEIELLQLESARLDVQIKAATLQNVQLQSGKINSDINTDKIQLVTELADANYTNARALETKVKASKTLDEMGIMANIPITQMELNSMAQTAAISEDIQTDILDDLNYDQDGNPIN